MIVALTVILVIVTLSSVLLALVIGNQEVVTARQSAYSGVTNADAGLSDALFRLDQAGTPDIPSSGSMCLNALNPADTKCSIQSTAQTPQLAGISYVARTVPSGTPPKAATQWVVQSIGNAKTGMHGAVQETLTRSTLYQFALFGKKSLSFSGNTTSGDFGTYTPGPNGTTNFTYCPNIATTPACMAIGSDGAVSCSGPSPLSVTGVYFNAGSGGGSDSCGTPQSKNTTYNVPDPTTPPAPNGLSWGCPNGGNLGSGATPAYPTISPGIYVCTSPVTITGTLQVLPATSPVQLYIMLPAASNTPTTTFLSVAQDSQINTTIPYSEMLTTGPLATDTLPQSDLFQVFTNSVGNLDVNGVHGFVFGGILYAPDATLTANGCKSYFFGSVNINTYTCNGGPNLGIFYDQSLAEDFGPWQISGYQQVNPSSVCIPDTTNNC